MAKQSRTKSALGGKKSKGSSRVPDATKKYVASALKKHVHRMHISKTANGKFLVDHEFKSAPGEPPIDSEQHAVNPEDLGAHVGEHMGIGAEPQPPAGAEPALPSASAAPTLPPAGPLGV